MSRRMLVAASSRLRGSFSREVPPERCKLRGDSTGERGRVRMPGLLSEVRVERCTRAHHDLAGPTDLAELASQFTLRSPADGGRSTGHAKPSRRISVADQAIRSTITSATG